MQIYREKNVKINYKIFSDNLQYFRLYSMLCLIYNTIFLNPRRKEIFLTCQNAKIIACTTGMSIIHGLITVAIIVTRNIVKQYIGIFSNEVLENKYF